VTAPVMPPFPFHNKI